MFLPISPFMTNFYLLFPNGRLQEDGSFIGQYGTLRIQVANAAAAVAQARAAAQAQAIGPGTYV